MGFWSFGVLGFVYRPPAYEVGQHLDELPGWDGRGGGGGLGFGRRVFWLEPLGDLCRVFASTCMGMAASARLPYKEGSQKTRTGWFLVGNAELRYPT